MGGFAIGDMVKMDHRCGRLSGKAGVVIALDEWENPTVLIGKEWKTFHWTQIEEVISENA